MANAPSPILNAFLLNHAAWFTTIADATMQKEGAPGFSANVSNGHGHITIAADGAVDRDLIESGLSWIRERSARRLLIWSERDDRGLDIALQSRGLTESFCPRWMLRDLADPLPGFPVPESIRIDRANASDLDALSAAAEIPYVDLDLARKVLTPAYAASVWMLLARDGGSGPVVGHLTLFLPNDDSGWAGVYGAGVEENLQRRGIGTALTLEACRIARDAGITHLSLNATPAGERAYRKAGFEVIGDGRTWFTEIDVNDPGPDKATIDWAERLAGGHASAADATRAASLSMPNGESPLAFAGRFDQADSGRWLLGHGATREIPALAKLKMWSELEIALADPGTVNRLLEPHGRTPLHSAVLENDPELVAKLLDAGADTSIKDRDFDSTASGWAHHLGRTELARMIDTMPKRRQSHL